MTVGRFWTHHTRRGTAPRPLPAPAPVEDRELGVSIGMKGRTDWPLWRLERLLEAVVGVDAARVFRSSLQGLPRQDKRHRVNAEIERAAALPPASAEPAPPAVEPAPAVPSKTDHRWRPARGLRSRDADI